MARLNFKKKNKYDVSFVAFLAHNQGRSLPDINRPDINREYKLGTPEDRRTLKELAAKKYGENSYKHILTRKNIADAIKEEDKRSEELCDINNTPQTKEKE